MNEADWDAFAATYAAVQRESRLPIQDDVVAALARALPLKTMRVLDLAAGSGRYALPLSRQAKQIELLDWSQQMLTQAGALLGQYQRQFTLTHADWTKLPPVPRADLVFVSQLPTLQPEQLPALLALTTHNLAINLQTLAGNSLITALAKQLNLPVPVMPQANPAKASALTTALTAHQWAFTTAEFRYHQTEQMAVADVLDAFDRPFSGQAANRLAQAVGAEHANQLLPVQEDYAFQLFIISKP